MLAYLLLPVGLVILMFGGDWLVKGASGLALKLNVPAVVIGLTIVAIGTSAPELVISLDAALIGAGGIAVGNVVGSNIANVLLVLGLPALIAPLAAPRDRLHVTLAFLVVATLLFMWLMATGSLERSAGLVLVLLLILFLVLQFRAARNGHAADLSDEVGDMPAETWKLVAYLIVGLAALPLGAKLTVDAAVAIARALSVSDEVIGLTIVAIGTSLPELATTVSAARAGTTSVAMGNVIGSNMFNIAAIMGITVLVQPVPVGPHIIGFDMWVMAGATAFLVVVALAGFRLGRRVGGLLLAAYLAYLVVTVLI